ncbi:hypothetical protein CC86DRAFT_404552 [Ophiobolus disseminans]|uniref:Uncharacterized protein n=1 Tax=Ophiobolus disseminans TaxID=1469910 RepID=A0A6A7A5S5_9PLEO|nr:hypothetical protein CC86DRAFT_404552 [Ophiobolus disseminans]
MVVCGTLVRIGLLAMLPTPYLAAPIVPPVDLVKCASSFCGNTRISSSEILTCKESWPTHPESTSKKRSSGNSGSSLPPANKVNADGKETHDPVGNDYKQNGNNPKDTSQGPHEFQHAHRKDKEGTSSTQHANEPLPGLNFEPLEDRTRLLAHTHQTAHELWRREYQPTNGDGHATSNAILSDPNGVAPPKPISTPQPTSDSATSSVFDGVAAIVGAIEPQGQPPVGGAHSAGPTGPNAPFVANSLFAYTHERASQVHRRSLEQLGSPQANTHNPVRLPNNVPRSEAEILYKLSLSASPRSGKIVEIMRPAPRIYRREARYGRPGWGNGEGKWGDDAGQLNDHRKQSQGGSEDVPRYPAGAPPSELPVRSSVPPPDTPHSASSAIPPATSVIPSSVTSSSTSGVAFSLASSIVASGVPEIMPADTVILLPAPAVYRRGEDVSEATAEQLDVSGSGPFPSPPEETGANVGDAHYSQSVRDKFQRRDVQAIPVQKRQEVPSPAASPVRVIELPLWKPCHEAHLPSEAVYARSGSEKRASCMRSLKPEELSESDSGGNEHMVSDHEVVPDVTQYLADMVESKVVRREKKSHDRADRNKKNEEHENSSGAGSRRPSTKVDNDTAQIKEKVEALDGYEVPDVYRRETNLNARKSKDTGCDFDALVKCAHAFKITKKETEACAEVRVGCSGQSRPSQLEVLSSYNVYDVHRREEGLDVVDGSQQDLDEMLNWVGANSVYKRDLEQKEVVTTTNQTAPCNSSTSANSTLLSNSTTPINPPNQTTHLPNNSQPLSSPDEPTKVKIQVTVLPNSHSSHELAPDVYDDPNAAKQAPSGPVEGEFGHEWGQGHFKRENFGASRPDKQHTALQNAPNLYMMGGKGRVEDREEKGDMYHDDERQEDMDFISTGEPVGGLKGRDYPAAPQPGGQHTALENAAYVFSRIGQGGGKGWKEKEHKHHGAKDGKREKDIGFTDAGERVGGVRAVRTKRGVGGERYFAHGIAPAVYASLGKGVEGGSVEDVEGWSVEKDVESWRV